MHFNGDFYVAASTAIPIFFITLALELRAASSPVMPRMVALYRYRKLRRFESIWERVWWIYRGSLLLLVALSPLVTVLGWAAEIVAMLSLDERRVSPAEHVVVLLGVIGLPTVILLWAYVAREHEIAPLEEELDELARERAATIKGLEEQVNMMAAADERSGEAAKARRRLALLRRQNKRLEKSTGSARRALRVLRDRSHG